MTETKFNNNDRDNNQNRQEVSVDSKMSETTMDESQIPELQTNIDRNLNMSDAQRSEPSYEFKCPKCNCYEVKIEYQYTMQWEKWKILPCRCYPEYYPQGQVAAIHKFTSHQFHIEPLEYFDDNAIFSYGACDVEEFDEDILCEERHCFCCKCVKVSKERDWIYKLGNSECIHSCEAFYCAACDYELQENEIPDVEIERPW